MLDSEHLGDHSRPPFSSSSARVFSVPQCVRTGAAGSTSRKLPRQGYGGVRKRPFTEVDGYAVLQLAGRLRGRGTRILRGRRLRCWGDHNLRGAARMASSRTPSLARHRAHAPGSICASGVPSQATAARSTPTLRTRSDAPRPSSPLPQAPPGTFVPGNGCCGCSESSAASSLRFGATFRRAGACRTATSGSFRLAHLRFSEARLRAFLPWLWRRFLKNPEFVVAFRFCV